eukprot:250223-Rhodomonas_salina.2
MCARLLPVYAHSLAPDAHVPATSLCTPYSVSGTDLRASWYQTLGSTQPTPREEEEGAAKAEEGA